MTAERGTHVGLEDLDVGIIEGDDLFLGLVVHLFLIYRQERRYIQSASICLLRLIE